MKNISEKGKRRTLMKTSDSDMEEEDSETNIKTDYFDESDCNSGDADNETYPIDMPLEVITTVQPFIYNYPILKNMSNGVLTHRNIFTDTEREILTKIVDQYRNIVDTRSRTREIYLEKQTVWQQIVEEYNSTDNVIVRTEKELRKCWDNMKYRARQAVKEQLKTEEDKQEIKTEVMNKVLSGLSSNSSSEMSTINSDSKEKEGLTEGTSTYSDDTSSHNYSDEEDEAPAFKKARQESPKLSSLLLGEGKVTNRLNNSTELGNYTPSNFTKFSDIKKKFTVADPSLINILPKGLNSCLSVMNIPNPNYNGSSSSNSDFYGNVPSEVLTGSINLGGGITISPQMNNNAAYENTLKTLPSRKKMSGRKNILNKSSSKQPDGPQFPPNSQSYCTGSKTELECKSIVKRLMMEEKEHHLRMKLLEKKVQAFCSKSQYWALKLKLLKAGKDSDTSILSNGNG